MAPVEPQKQPATRQYQPGVRTSRGDIAHPRSGYGADEEERQGSPGIQNHTVLSRSGGGGNRRGPPRSAPPRGDDGGDASDEHSSSSDSSSTGGHQPGSSAQNDHPSDSDLSGKSEESDWGSDNESVDGLGNFSDPGFMLVVRNVQTLRDAAEDVELPKVCLRMMSEDPLHQGWEIANFLTVRGNAHRLKRALSNLVRTDEAVESREHLPARRVLEDIASSTRNRKFRSPYELEQATNSKVAWGFEVNLFNGQLTVYAPPRIGGIVWRENIFRDALRQDGDRVPGLIHRYWFHELRGFDNEAAFRRDVLSRFSTEAAEHYWVPRLPQGLQGLRSPAQLEEAHGESTSPSVTTPSSIEDRETVNGYPATPLMPTYATHPAPWRQQQHRPGPHNQVTESALPVFGNGPGTLTGRYDGGYTGGQGGNHTTGAPPQGPQTPNLPFQGGYRGGAIGGLPPGSRLRYTDDPDSGDDVEDERPSRPLPALRQYTPRNGPVTWDSPGGRPDIDATEAPDRPWTTPGSNYDTYEPTSPNQGYSPRARSEDRNLRDDSNASTGILDQNNGGEGPARRSPLSYPTCGPPAKVFTQQPTAGSYGAQEAGSNASDPGQENEEDIPPFYRFDTVRPPPGPRTPLPVYDRLLQYRDYRPIDSDSDSSVDLRREPYGDGDGSPTLRIRAAIRQTASGTVDASPERPPFRRARGVWRRRPRTMSPGAIRETIENDSEDKDSRPVQQPRHTISPGVLRYRIFEDDLPDLGGPARSATEDDLPDYESDSHELPTLTRGRAPSPGARRCSAADASPGPPDSALEPRARALSPREAGYAADESDSDSDSTFGSDSDSESDSDLDSSSSGSGSDSDDSPGPPDSARPPSGDSAAPSSPERDAQDADDTQVHAASLEPTPAPARESEEIVFRDPEWGSPSREPVDEDVGPRTMSPPVGGGYIHEDAYPHPLLPTRNNSEDGGQEKECGEGYEQGQGVDSSVAGSDYQALVAEEQRLMREYTALLDEQSRRPAGAQRMLVSADYYSSPEPEERAGWGAGGGGYISVESSPP